MEVSEFPPPRLGDFQIWWIPRIPGKPFTKRVSTPEEGKLLLDVLAEYDLFLLENRLREDFAVVGGLSVYEDNGNPEDPSWYDYEEEYSE